MKKYSKILNKKFKLKNVKNKKKLNKIKQNLKLKRKSK
jgi:hypothetical protein